MTGLGIALLMGEFVVDGPVLIVFGAVIWRFARRFVEEAKWLARVDDAQRAWCAGDVEGADEMLADVPARARRGAVASAVGAFAAVRMNEEGRYSEAMREAEAALTPRRDLAQVFFRSFEIEPMALAHAARAMAAAALNDEAAVRAEQAWVAQDRDAPAATRAVIDCAAAFLDVGRTAAYRAHAAPSHALVGRAARPGVHGLPKIVSARLALNTSCAALFALLVVALHAASVRQDVQYNRPDGCCEKTAAAGAVRFVAVPPAPLHISMACLAVAAGGLLLVGTRKRLRGAPACA